MAKGISKERIIETAKALIAEKGRADFSMHALAARLNIKTASLYSHVSGIDEVLVEASKAILKDYHDQQMQAISGKKRREALMALAQSEREYAKENPAFYDLIMNLQLSDNQELKDTAACIVEPVMQILDGYPLSDAQKTDAERAFRACVYGFVSQEKHAYFSHFKESTEKSFGFAINAVASGIEAMTHEN